MATETLAHPAPGPDAPLEPPSPMAARLVSYSFSREAPLLIAHQRPDGLEVWVSRKTSPAALAEVARVHGALHLRVLESAALEAAMSDAYNRQDGSAAQVVGEVEGEVDLSRLMQDIPAVEDLLESEDDAPIIRMINALLAELLRQWSTFQPEFAFLPRKFKIAISASKDDRAVVQMHDIGIYAYRNAQGETRLRILAGGGLGRTPILGTVIKEDLPWQHMLTYVESAIRVYNRYGRRDNKYKARIKILVKAIGAEKFAAEVEEEWQHSKDGPGTLTQAEFDRVAQYFQPPAYEKLADTDATFETHLLESKAFARWVTRNVHAHKVPGYAAVTLSTKPGPASPPGDATAEQMDAVADFADRFGYGELRVAHEQNLVLPDVKKRDLFALWEAARKVGLATANIGLLTDIIACPGGDFCSLANAKSIPIALGIQQRFVDLDYVYDLGEISLNISGCINACGHHHVGNIGVLGVDKDGSEWYQVTLGGAQGNESAIGKVIGPSFSAEEMPDVVTRIIDTFVANRAGDERFIDTFARIGMAPFKERVYADKQREERAEA